MKWEERRDIENERKKKEEQKKKLCVCRDGK